MVNPNLSGVDAVRLAPIWELKTYTVTLNSGTGINNTTITVTKDTSTITAETGNYITDTSPSITVGFGSTIQISYAIIPGYHFTGWEITNVGIDADGNPLLTEDDLALLSGMDSANNSAYGFTVPASDLALTAKAEGNKYTVHFSANGGLGEMTDVEMTYGSSSTLPVNTFTAPRDYYEFYGWTAEPQIPSATPSRDYTDGQTGVFNLAISNAAGTGEATIYAVWQLHYDDIMQNWSYCANLQVSTAENYEDESTYEDLLDTRNNVVYRVRRYADNNCWMDKNLALTPGTTAPINDVTSGTLTTSSIDSEDTGTITFTENFSTSSYTEFQARFDAENASASENTTYFSWNAARVACPAGWTLPTNAQWNAFLGSEVIESSAEGSEKIRNAPYRFVYTGRYNGSSLTELAAGYFWTADESTASPTTEAYRLGFSATAVRTTDSYKYYALPVRCVQEYTVTMQNFAATDCAELTASTTENYEDRSTYKILKDTRNSVFYLVRRYADNMCWMAQNLALTPGDTAPTADVTSGTRVLTTNDSQGAGTVTFVSGFSSANKASPPIQGKYETNNKSASTNIGYYSWTAAIIVCPKSWTLPTMVQWASFISSEGIPNSAEGSILSKQAPYAFPYTGYYNSSTFKDPLYGVHAWSATEKGSGVFATEAYDFVTDDSSVRSNNDTPKRYGFPVRCLHS